MRRKTRRTGLTAVHFFDVPDESWATSLLDALLGYGYPSVLARPDGTAVDRWQVVVVDEGPYPPGEAGYRQFTVVTREAARLARRHQGVLGGSLEGPNAARDWRSTPTPYAQYRRRSRPPIPTVPDPLPDASLASEPDPDSRLVATGAALDGLDDVDWHSLDHAHGSADDVPDLLRTMAANGPDWFAAAGELLGDNVLHQGICYSATAPTLTFLGRLSTDGGFGQDKRGYLYLTLLGAAAAWADGLLRSVDLTVHGSPRTPAVPEAAPWTQQVHAAVGEQVPTMLDRWNLEPPNNRFRLACLAALYPEHGRVMAGEVTALATEHAGTRHARYLRLATALLDGDDEQALALAADIVSWDIGSVLSSDYERDTAWLDQPVLPAALVAGHLLAQAGQQLP